MKKLFSFLLVIAAALAACYFFCPEEHKRKVFSIFDRYLSDSGPKGDEEPNFEERIENSGKRSKKEAEKISD